MGLAVLATVATVAASRTEGRSGPQALASGYALAFQAGVAILVGCALLMLLTLPGERRAVTTSCSRPSGAGPTLPP